MSFKKYDGQNYVDTNSQKRFDGANWIDVSSIKRFDGANWIETLATPVNMVFSGLSTNVSIFSMKNVSSTQMSWYLTLRNSEYWTYVYIVAEGLILNKGDIVTFKARNVHSMQYGVRVTVQASNADSNAVELGLVLQEYTFIAPFNGGLPCFKITRAYNGVYAPQGTIEFEYFKINGKQYKPIFKERQV